MNARVSERLIEAAFASSVLITGAAAAKLLGVDEKTLREMAQGGLIRSVLIGEGTRRYTEADLRAFIDGTGPALERKPEPCPSTSRRSRGSRGPGAQILSFSEIQRDGHPKGA